MVGGQEEKTHPRTKVREHFSSASSCSKLIVDFHGKIMWLTFFIAAKKISRASKRNKCFHLGIFFSFHVIILATLESKE